MRNTQTRFGCVVLACLLAIAAPTGFSQSVDEYRIVEQARKAYYNLPSQGLKGFRCDVQVDWSDIVAGLKLDDAGRQKAMQFLSQLHFQASVGPSGAAEISHHFDGAPPNEQAAQGLRTTTDGVEQMLAGFFQSWSTFVFGLPLPEDSDRFRAEPQGDEFRVTSGSDAMRMVETLNKDYAIEELLVTTQNTTAQVKPQFQRTDKGYVPVVLDTTLAASGADKIGVHMEISYQTVQGFQLAQTVSVVSKTPNGDTHVRFSFSNYQIAQ